MSSRSTLRAARVGWLAWQPRAVAALALTVCVLVVAGCGGGSSSRGEFTFTAPGGQTQLYYDPPAVRGRAPVMAGDNVTDPGRQVSSADYPGRLIVINVWGSWCGPCRRETPALERVFEQTRGLGVQFLGIDVRDERAAAADFIRDRGVTYPSIYDPPGRSLIALRGYPRNVVPSTIVLDRQHRVAAVFLSALTVDELLPVVRRLAAEPTEPAGPPAATPAPADGLVGAPSPAGASPAPGAPGGQR